MRRVKTGISDLARDRIPKKAQLYVYSYVTAAGHPGFWATVYKTVRPMLSDRCPVLSCLSCLSVTLVYCGQTVGWIKLKLGLQVGLGPSHIVLDGDPPHPPPKGHSPQFSAHICCGQMAAWIKMPLGTEVGLGRNDIVLDGDPALPPQKWAEPPPQFSAHVVVAKRLDGSRWHLAWRWVLIQATLC